MTDSPTNQVNYILDTHCYLIFHLKFQTFILNSRRFDDIIPLRIVRQSVGLMICFMIVGMLEHFASMYKGILVYSSIVILFYLTSKPKQIKTRMTTSIKSKL